MSARRTQSSAVAAVAGISLICGRALARRSDRACVRPRRSKSAWRRPLRCLPQAPPDPPRAAPVRAPRAVRLTRLSGPRVRLSWSTPARSRAPHGLPGAARRAHRRADDTDRDGRSPSCSAGARRSRSRPATRARPVTCARASAARLALAPPSRVRGLRVLAVTATGVRIGWRRARARRRPGRGLPDRARRRRRRADARAELHAEAERGARAPHRGRRRRHPRARGSAEQDAADRRHPPRRRRSRAARPARYALPGTPGALSVSDVSDAGATLWWMPSRPGSARIIGYRVYRDEHLVVPDGARLAAPDAPLHRCRPT